MMDNLALKDDAGTGELPLVPIETTVTGMWRRIGEWSYLVLHVIPLTYIHCVFGSSRCWSYQC